MILYTPTASTELGGDNAAVAKAQAHIMSLNTAFSDSGISTTAKLAGTQRITPSFTGDKRLNDAIRHITSDQSVSTWRTDKKADLVTCIVSKEGGGSAWGLGSFLTNTNGSKNVYASSFWSSVPGETFAHEIGHNMGCAHDRDNSSSQGTYSYSYGNHFSGTDKKDYRTIMAYNKNGERRVLKFSGPTIMHEGTATGKANDTDNAKSISQMLPKISEYY